MEQVDEPSTKIPKTPSLLFGLDLGGKQKEGCNNKLIWVGDDLIFSSLKNSPIKEEIGKYI
jgi:hypothetical protein